MYCSSSWKGVALLVVPSLFHCSSRLDQFWFVSRVAIPSISMLFSWWCSVLGFLSSGAMKTNSTFVHLFPPSNIQTSDHSSITSSMASSTPATASTPPALQNGPNIHSGPAHKHQFNEILLYQCTFAGDVYISAHLKRFHHGIFRGFNVQ